MQEQLNETWRPIPGFEGFYSASDQGRIRSEPLPFKTTGRQRGRILSPSPNLQRKGYLQVRLCVPGKKGDIVQVHRVVALVFIGPCPDGLQVNHKDCDKTNNRPRNLEYVTCAENVRHCWANGMHGVEHCTGEANTNAKLTAEKVREIRALYPSLSLSKLATKYGVTKENVHAVVRRKTWAHV